MEDKERRVRVMSKLISMDEAVKLGLLSYEDYEETKYEENGEREFFQLADKQLVESVQGDIQQANRQGEATGINKAIVKGYSVFTVNADPISLEAYVKVVE